MDTEPLEANLAPRAGCAVLAVPIAITAILVIGYGTFFVAGVRGRPATGEVARMAFTGCDEARPIVEARVAAMGLGEPTYEDTAAGFVVSARLPADPAVAAGIPATLAAPGRLVVRDGTAPDGEILATEADIADAMLRLDYTVSPRVGVTMEREAAKRITEHAEAHTDGTTSVWLDGVLAAERHNGPGTSWDKFDLGPTGEDASVVHTVAAWALVLQDGPLPCDLSVALE